MIMPFVAFGQEDVTKFLGIPIDGFKVDMIKKLQAKGYTLEKTYDGKQYLSGEFNGQDVSIHIVTNNNKVWRIMVADKNTCDKTQIKIRFNRLLEQFVNNGKYIALDDFIIPNSEDIEYEMLANSKRYEAVFCQLPADTAAFNKEIRELYLSKYTPEQYANPTERMRKDVNAMIMSVLEKTCLHKKVWFCIEMDGIEYSVFMYYDNEKNRANGEDL